MPIMTVESVTLTKSGKAYSVKSGGKYYVTSKGTGIEQVMPGQQIDATLGSFSAPDGSRVATIDSFAKANGNASKPAQNGSGDAQFVDRYYMAFVSNVVAHAIQCGKIEAPGDIWLWASAAKRAAVRLDQTDDPLDPMDAVSGLDAEGNRIPF